VKFGIALGAVHAGLWTAVTEEADRLGFDSVWMPEHLVLPVSGDGSPYAGQDHPPVPPDVPIFDVWAYLGFLAGRTSRLRFGTHVYNIGLRHPFATARAVATLEIISGNRFEFGIGASWLAEEWEAVGLDFATRGRRVDEAIEVCRQLWTDKLIEHHGEFFDFDPVMFEPKPAQPPILVIGGDGPAALRRAATEGDGWIPMNHTLEQIPASAGRIAELRAAAGRPGRTEITMGGSIASPADVDRYAEARVDRVLVRPWARSKEALEGMRRFAGELGLDSAVPG
jgi:probable F420-dependent oxidoreductase